ncbi:zinc ribbon domain-containing protein [Thiothrix fructosivorans]|uniref:Transposase n=1 Tax=Thiothrix fructosivorans TaxID=111770 RepID=A0A8B0SJV4_9GAMM|nr:zinc ribbon domain-containing protein [Thiothrix fructosivorans]MBO0613987.1 transposase [Thiothrix fructosivorans]QTX10348.1 transposase [Thiothrix fructosivorans]
MQETLRFSGKILSATVSHTDPPFPHHRQDRFFASSKTCSAPGCGHKVDKLPLSVREWACPTCGRNHDRNVNAAINLANYAVSDTVSACGREGASRR